MPSRSVLPPTRMSRLPVPFWAQSRETLLASALAKVAHDLRPTTMPERQRSPEDQALYEACRFDVKQFALAFLPHLCPTEFSSMHEEFFARYQADAGARGLRDATAAPRQFAKTTIIGKIKVIHDCVYQHEHYIVIISSRDDLAVDKVKDVRSELEGNARLIQVYGGQVGPLWNMDDIITAQGVRVRAIARGTQARGLLWGKFRPSKILPDDAEHAEHVLTLGQREKTWNWFAEDISKLGDAHTNIEAIGTLLHDDSLLAKLLANPGYRSRRYQAVLRFADASAIPLWQQWRAIFIDLENPHHQADALAFYQAHEAEMLQGSAVLWPAEYPYYRLMVERLVDGESAFFKERQNQPQRDQRRLFDMDAAAYCLVSSEGVQRADGILVPWTHIHDVAAFWDPTPDKRPSTDSDYAACAVVLRDQAGYYYAVDAYVAQEMSTQAQITAIVDLLWHWQVPVLGIEGNGFQSLLASDIRAAIVQRSQDEGIPWSVDLWPITNLRNKILRIRSLEPLVLNGWLQFARTLPSQALQQMAEVLPIPGAGHDDYPDSLEGAVRVLKHLLDRRSAA